MNVRLLSCTKDADVLIATAGKTCYSDKPPELIYDDFMHADQEKVDHMLGVIHGSVLEHVIFMFSIEGVSRACTHQLVRHRHSSFSQQSQRYVKMDPKGTSIVIPHTVRELMDDETEASTRSSKVTTAYNRYLDALNNLNDVLKDKGVPNEDVRYFYPQGIKSNIIVTMNARELMTVFNLRVCDRAQWEIREVATRMLEICKREYPNIFKDAGPSCKQLGYCPEHKSCGKMPTLDMIKSKE